MTRVIGVIQARMGSTRLPGKVLRPLGDREVLAWVIRAAQVAGCVDEVVVATTTLADDDAVAALGAREGASVVRGPADDVLARFLRVLDARDDVDAVIRLTADCPLLDPSVVRLVARTFAAGGFDYVGTGPPDTLPRGLDVEVVSAAALRVAGELAAGSDRSHVTSYVSRNAQKFRVHTIAFSPRADDLRVTLDTEADWTVITEVVRLLGTAPPAWLDLVALLRANPEIAAINRDIRQKSVDEP